MSVSVKWKDVVGYEGLYQVSNTGLVRSLDKEVFARGRGSTYVKVGKLLCPSMNQCGYPIITLTRGIKQRTQHTVHSLVAAAFLGPQPTGYEVCHFDDVRVNNALSNLRYGTPSDNSKDAKRNGVGQSRYTGVFWHAGGKKWMAQFSTPRKYLGLHKTELEAARAYDKYIIDNNIKDRALNNV